VLLRERGRALPSLDLLPELTGLIVGELEGPPALPGGAVTGTRRARRPSSSPSTAASPAGALEGVVHGGERDLQLLGERGRALPALDLLPEPDGLFVAELERSAPLGGCSVAQARATRRPSVEEMPCLLDDSLQLLPERGVLLHHRVQHVLEMLDGAGDGARPAGHSGHGA